MLGFVIAIPVIVHSYLPKLNPENDVVKIDRKLNLQPTFDFLDAGKKY
jgi:hypothetical protein